MPAVSMTIIASGTVSSTSCRRASRSASSVKARRVVVMSRATFEAPTSRPAASHTGETVSETSMICPSARRRRVSKCSTRSPRCSRSMKTRSSSSWPSGKSMVIGLPTICAAL